MAYFQGKVAFRQLIFGGYLVAITRILGYNTHRWMLIVYLELFTLKLVKKTFHKQLTFDKKYVCFKITNSARYEWGSRYGKRKERETDI